MKKIIALAVCALVSSLALAQPLPSQAATTQVQQRYSNPTAKSSTAGHAASSKKSKSSKHAAKSSKQSKKSGKAKPKSGHGKVKAKVGHKVH